MTTITKDQFNEIIRAFRAKANAKQIHSHDIIAYNLIRGLDPKRGFAVITNTNKLANGCTPTSTYDRSLQGLGWIIAHSRTSWIAALPAECKAYLQAAYDAAKGK